MAKWRHYGLPDEIGKRKRLEQIIAQGFSLCDVTRMNRQEIALLLGCSSNRARRVKSLAWGLFHEIGKKKQKGIRIYREPDREPIDKLADSMFWGSPKSTA